MNAITITIYWNPKTPASAQHDLEAIVNILENNSNTEPPQLENEIGLIRAECTGLKTIEGHGQ